MQCMIDAREKNMCYIIKLHQTNSQARSALPETRHDFVLNRTRLFRHGRRILTHLNPVACRLFDDRMASRLIHVFVLKKAMIACPKCGKHPCEPDAPCPKCAFQPQRIDGFLAWAPELAREYQGFPTDAFAVLAESEKNNFWFESRNKLITWALSKHFPGMKSMLEVGCGTGFVLSGIAECFPDARLVGSEILTAGLHHAKQRLPKTQLIQMDARQMPFQSEFDVVAAFDVIEHIHEDDAVLNNLFRATKPGGGCLITVPQHQWLWSPADEQACHVRRYDAKTLHRKVESAGFSIARSTSFVSLLLPVMLISRWSNRKKRAAVAEKEFQLNPLLNTTLRQIMDTERAGIRFGINLPMGGSRLVIALKP